jgi:hypothetical protein
MNVSSGYSWSTYSDRPSSSVSPNRSSSIAIVNLFDEILLLHICRMQDHCFLLAGGRADFWLATLRHLHTSLFASDASYCKDMENEVLVVWLVSQSKNISYNARRLSRKLHDITMWHEVRHPRTSKQHEKCNTKNGTTDHDSVSPISPTSTPHLEKNHQHLAHIYTWVDILLRFFPRWAVMKTLQLFYKCWLEVTKQKRYHNKWLNDET